MLQSTSMCTGHRTQEPTKLSSPRKPRSYRPRKSRHNAQLAGRPIPPEKMRKIQQLPRNGMWSPSQRWRGWPRYLCRMPRNRSEEELRRHAWPFTHALENRYSPFTWMRLLRFDVSMQIFCGDQCLGLVLYHLLLSGASYNFIFRLWVL